MCTVHHSDGLLRTSQVILRPNVGEFTHGIQEIRVVVKECPNFFPVERGGIEAVRRRVDPDEVPSFVEISLQGILASLREHWKWRH